VVDGFTNEHDSMVKGAQAVQDAHQKIHGQLGKLQQQVDDMLSQWSGGASRSFHGAHAAFAEQGMKLNNALDNMHQALVATTQSYTQTEDEHSSTFNNIAGQL
jgi:WXG100 family type VII secretion target